LDTVGSRALGTVFLDRDGTINRKAASGDYVKKVDEFALLPGAVEGVRALNNAGQRVIIVTNQRGIALGRMSEEDLAAIHQHMVERFAEAGASVDAIYYCPHDYGSCDCRKPEVGMFLRAAQERAGVILSESAIVGDSRSDMQAGTALGMVRVLIGSDGDPRSKDWCVRADFDYCAPSLIDGVEWLLRARSATANCAAVTPRVPTRQ